MTMYQSANFIFKVTKKTVSGYGDGNNKCSNQNSK